MNEILNKFLQAGDKFMPELHLKNNLDLPIVFVVHYQKQGKIEKFMLTGNTDFIYRNELNKACF